MTVWTNLGCMTPRLVPYSILRYGVSPMLSGAFALVAWWFALVLLEYWRDGAMTSAGNDMYAPETETLIFLSIISVAVSISSILIEGRFRRTTMVMRGFGVWFSGLFTGLAIMLWMWLYNMAVNHFELIPPGSLALRWRVGPWLIAGAAATWGPWLVRMGRRLIEMVKVRWKLEFVPAAPPLEGGVVSQTALHGIAGLTAGLTAALGWYFCGLALGDRFVASAVGAWLLGGTVGALLFVVPESHFVGWMRVRRGNRPGWRVHLDPADPARSERFIGHFTRGMDVHMPPTDGSAELHVSFVAKEEGNWSVRGLSQQRVGVARPLERIELAYDPSLPAPLETPLRNGDIVRISELGEVEFVVATEEGAP